METPTPAEHVFAEASPPPPGPPPPRRRSAGWVVALVLGVAALLALGGCCAFFGIVGSAGGVRPGGPGIALIHIDSAIADGGPGSTGATPERLINLLRKAEKDPSVKAVLLRINSPGGTVSASQEIAMEVARFSKPVVADIGDVGASGAYYVASQCDTIVATPSSAVGSIGIIMEIPNVEGLMKKLGVSVTVVREGTFKDAGSPFRSLTSTELAMLKQDLKPPYDQFIAAVAKGRKLPEKKVREMATGWVWPGVQAKEMGLVDVLGNYADAVALTGESVGLGRDPEVIDYDEVGILDVLGRFVGAFERLGAPSALQRESVPR